MRVSGRFVLATIVLAAIGLAAAWALLVPVLQGPDENVHLDYVFALQAAGGLLNARQGTQEPDPSRPVSPLLALIEERTDFFAVRQHGGRRVPVGYGRPEFRSTVDAEARSLSAPSELPFLVSYYPVAYYALAALVMAAALHFTGPFEAVIAVRLLSVAMLGATLLAAFALFRRLGVGEAKSLALTAILGLLPLTTFVASYAQPDNLALLATTLCLLLATSALRPSAPRFSVAALGIALALLALSKYQDFAIVGASILASLAVNRRLTAWRTAALLVPIVAALSIQAWVSIGPSPAYFSAVPDPTGRRPSTAALHDALAAGPVHVVAFLGVQAWSALADYFLDGQVAVSFWGRFGWLDTPLMIGSLPITIGIRLLVWAGTVAVLALAVLTLLRVVVVIRRAKPRTALRMLFGNPVVTSYVGFLVFMVAAYVYTGGSLYPQGRYWLPFLPGLLYVTVIYAPRVIGSRRRRTTVQVVLIASLLAYVAASVPSAIVSIHSRYYGPSSAAGSAPSSEPGDNSQEPIGADDPRPGLTYSSLAPGKVVIARADGT